MKFCFVSEDGKSILTHIEKKAILKDVTDKTFPQKEYLFFESSNECDVFEICAAINADCNVRLIPCEVEEEKSDETD